MVVRTGVTHCASHVSHVRAACTCMFANLLATAQAHKRDVLL